MYKKFNSKLDNNCLFSLFQYELNFLSHFKIISLFNPFFIFSHGKASHTEQIFKNFLSIQKNKRGQSINKWKSALSLQHLIFYCRI